MNSKQIDKQLQAYVNEKTISGGILMIRKNGDLIYQQPVGYADKVGGY